MMIESRKLKVKKFSRNILKKYAIVLNVFD